MAFFKPTPHVRRSPLKPRFLQNVSSTNNGSPLSKEFEEESNSTDTFRSTATGFMVWYGMQMDDPGNAPDGM
jgi:hypothetical protein